MASTARLSFFYRHHNAYRIQKMLNHNSSTWENESELIHFFVSRILDESKLIHSGVYVNLYVYPPWLSSLWTGTCFASIACGHPHAHFWGVPQTPALFLRDDSDADDARDAVFRTSLYHIPDSASLASSASFWFCVSRNITIFVLSSSKLQASFHYKRDGGDDGDGLSCIPLPISHKHRHYRHHRHLKQASRFNLRLACFILSNVARFLPHCLLKWI